LLTLSFPHLPTSTTPSPTRSFLPLALKVGATEELKGTSASNDQFLGHECVRFGAQTICEICEDFVCGNDVNVLRTTPEHFVDEEFISGQSGGDITVCHNQLQGMNYSFLPRNVPTVTSSPFAVGSSVQHRNDFGRADRVCMVLSGGKCMLPGEQTKAGSLGTSGDSNSSSSGDDDTVVDLSDEDFSDCVTRCWGSNVRYKPFPKQRFDDTYSGYQDYAGWEYYKDDVQQQGR
jgi:hypothetical protein